MSRQKALITSFIALISLGQPLLIGSTAVIMSASAAVMLSAKSAYAQSAKAYVDQGVEKGKRGDFQGAIADFNKAIEIDPKYLRAYCNLGLAKARGLGDFEGAISHYDKCIEIDPESARAYVKRGEARKIVGDLQGACADWKEASSLGDNAAAGLVRDQCQ